MADSQAGVEPVLRFGSGVLRTGPGPNKCLTHEQSVRSFTAPGLPGPATVVVIVGLVELVAAGPLVAGPALAPAALLTAPVVAVAAVTAEPTWQNRGVPLAGLDRDGVAVRKPTT